MRFALNTSSSPACCSLDVVGLRCSSMESMPFGGSGETVGVTATAVCGTPFKLVSGALGSMVVVAMPPGRITSSRNSDIHRIINPPDHHVRLLGDQPKITNYNSRSMDRQISNMCRPLRMLLAWGDHCHPERRLNIFRKHPNQCPILYPSYHVDS